MIDIGKILGAGFQLIAERPVAVAIWTAINFVLAAAGGLAIVPFMSQQAALSSGAVSPAAALGTMAPLFALYPVMLLVFVVLWGAVYRSIFRPDEDSFGYLRVGMDELRLLGVGLLYFLAYVALWIAITIGAVIIGVAGVGVGSAGIGSSIVAGILFVLIFIGAVAAILIFSVRFSLAFPLTFLRRRIQIAEAWTLSRGHFWALFVCALVIMIGMFIVLAITGMISNAGYFSAILAAQGNPEAIERAAAAQFGTIGVFTVVGWVLNAVATTLWLVLNAAGIATAAQQLAPETADEIEDVWS